MEQPDKKALIIIGAGLTGLSAGIAWCLAGNPADHPVLVLEKEPSPGGYAASYQRRGFRIDTCQLLPDISQALNYLGVKPELAPFDRDFIRLFLASPAGCKRIDLPCGLNAFRAQLTAYYPQEAARIGRFLSYTEKMFLELYRLKMEPGPTDVLKMLFTAPKTVLNASRTFDDLYKSFHFKNPEIKEIFNVFTGMNALPANRVHAMVPVSAMHCLLQGSFRPVHGFGSMARCFADRFVSLGGELRTRARVEKILVEAGRVKGVKLVNGELIHSERVISTADTKTVMQNMVGLDLLRGLDAAYAGKIEAMEMSGSSFTVNIGLKKGFDPGRLGLAAGYNVLTRGEAYYHKLYNAFLHGQSAFSENCFHLGMNYSDSVLTLGAMPAAPEPWLALRANNRVQYQEEKRKKAERIIGLVEKHVLPGLSNAVETLDIATPATYARYSGSPTGSIYDMAPLVDNFGRNRVKMRTPVGGLIHPKFIHGLFGAVHGGIQAVDLLLNNRILGGRCRF